MSTASYVQVRETNIIEYRRRARHLQLSTEGGEFGAL